MAGFSLDQLKAQAAVALEGVDNTVEKAGGADYTIPPGNAFLRMTEYVEVGSYVQSIPGKPDKVIKDALVLGFQVYPAPQFDEDGNEVAVDQSLYQNGKGEWKVWHTFPMSMAQTAKGNLFKFLQKNKDIFKATAYADLINGQFMQEIPPSEKDPNRGYPVFNELVAARDPMTKKFYKGIPEAKDDDFKFFVWAKPTIEQWQSLDGPVTDDGQVLGMHQKRIMQSPAFEGSPIEHVLKKAGVIEDYQTMLAAALKRDAERKQKGGKGNIQPTVQELDDEASEAAEAQEIKAPVKGKGLPSIKRPKVALATPDEEDEE